MCFTEWPNTTISRIPLQRTNLETTGDECLRTRLGRTNVKESERKANELIIFNATYRRTKSNSKRGTLRRKLRFLVPRDAKDINYYYKDA